MNNDKRLFEIYQVVYQIMDDEKVKELIWPVNEGELEAVIKKREQLVDEIMAKVQEGHSLIREIVDFVIDERVRGLWKQAKLF
jgi:hypothetical protein